MSFYLRLTVNLAISAVTAVLSNKKSPPTPEHQTLLASFIVAGQNLVNNW